MNKKRISMLATLLIVSLIAVVIATELIKIPIRNGGIVSTRYNLTATWKATGEPVIDLDWGEMHNTAVSVKTSPEILLTNTGNTMLWVGWNYDGLPDGFSLKMFKYEGSGKPWVNIPTGIPYILWLQDQSYGLERSQMMINFELTVQSWVHSGSFEFTVTIYGADSDMG
jgi:hypothetical protein